MATLIHSRPMAIPLLIYARQKQIGKPAYALLGVTILGIRQIEFGLDRGEASVRLKLPPIVRAARSRPVIRALTRHFTHPLP